MLNFLIDKAIALPKKWKTPRELISLASLLALVLAIFIVVAKSGRGEDPSALTDAYADRAAVCSALEQVFVQADGDLQATLGELEAQGFTCTRLEARPQHDVWCRYRGTFDVEIGRELPPVPFLREIGVSVADGALRASLGYILTDRHAEDEEVHSELERLYSSYAQTDLGALIDLLETEGYACSATESQGFNHYCDLRTPIPFVFQDGMRFMLELRRQILLAATDSGLRIRVASHLTGL